MKFGIKTLSASVRDLIRETVSGVGSSSILIELSRDIIDWFTEIRIRTATIKSSKLYASPRSHPMDSESLEIECPMCDRRIASNAKECPFCGADFSTAGMDELEDVARDISEGRQSSVPATMKATPEPHSTAAVVAVPEASPEPVHDEKAEITAQELDRESKEKGGLRRLFGRKKH